MNRALTWLHRWAGVLLCLVALLWFASGVVIHFVPYPYLPETIRLEHIPPIDLARLRAAPAEVIWKWPQAASLRLVGIQGDPVYVISIEKTLVAVSAESGQPLPPVAASAAQRIAESFGHADVTRVEGPIEYDQWIVHQRFDPWRPFYRVRMADAEGTDLYVSTRTGEVVQRTSSFERAWNWPGAVLHWTYFTPLRKSYPAWNYTVWWLSLSLLATSIIGTWLGILRTLRHRSSGRYGLSPFRGWMRWHHTVGLFASLVVIFWVFSGWLSMDHGRLFSRGWPTAEQSEAIRGLPLASIAEAASPSELSSLGQCAEIDFNGVLGRPFLTMRGGGNRTYLHWLDHQPETAQVPSSLLAHAVTAVWPGATPAADADSGTARLYRAAESLSDEAQAYVTPGTHPTRIYMDTTSAQILVVMNPSRIAYAWIFYGLHTLKFPGLNSIAVIRRIIVLSLLALGIAFSVTGVVLGYKRLRRQFVPN